MTEYAPITLTNFIHELETVGKSCVYYPSTRLHLIAVRQENKVKVAWGTSFYRVAEFDFDVFVRLIKQFKTASVYSAYMRIYNTKFLNSAKDKLIRYSAATQILGCSWQTTGEAFYCPICGHKFTGPNAKMQMESCSKLEIPQHRFQVGDVVEVKWENNNQLTILETRIHRQGGKNVPPRHAAFYKVKTLQGDERYYAEKGLMDLMK